MLIPPPSASAGGGGASTLAALTDVSLAGLAGDDLLAYDSGAAEWQNKTLADVGLDAHDLLDGTRNQDTLTGAVSRGSLIYGNATPLWAELVVGSNLDVLATDGLDVAWTALTASHVQSGTFADARVAESNVTQHVAAIDHDALLNFVADEHVAHSGVTFSAGVGLTGGGDLSANRTFDLDISTLTPITTPAATDELAIYDAGVGQRAITFANLEAGLDHDALAGYVAAEHIRWSSTGAEDVHADRIPASAVTQHEGSIDHDALTNFVAAEHIDWSVTGAEDVHADRIAAGAVTQHEGSINHDALSGFVANEHLDWSQDQGATDIHSGNIPDLSGTYQPLDSDLTAIAGISGVAGDILYYNSGWNALAAGTNGQVLKLSAGLPSWQDEGGGTSHALGSATHTDVVITAVGDNEVLAYDSTSGDWINQTASEAGLQPNDATLTALAGLSVTTDDLILATGADAFSTLNVPPWSQSMISVSDEATFKSYVNLEPGTDVQAYDSDLNTIAGLTPATGDFLYHTGGGWTVFSIGSAGEVLRTADGTNATWGKEFVTIVWTFDSTIETGDERPWFANKSGRTMAFEDAYAVLKTAGTTGTTITIEKCSQTNIDGTQSWSNIFGTDLTIDANEQSSNTAATSHAFTGSLAAGDHLRLNVSAVGASAAGLTVVLVLRYTN